MPRNLKTKPREGTFLKLKLNCKRRLRKRKLLTGGGLGFGKGISMRRLLTNGLKLPRCSNMSTNMCSKTLKITSF